MSHAENLHLGISMLGNSLANTIVQNNQMRRQAALEAAAEANSVDAVRRLANALAASRSRETALEAQIVQLQFELGRARAALRRGA